MSLARRRPTKAEWRREEGQGAVPARRTCPSRGCRRRRRRSSATSRCARWGSRATARRSERTASFMLSGHGPVRIQSTGDVVGETIEGTDAAVSAERGRRSSRARPGSHDRNDVVQANVSSSSTNRLRRRHDRGVESLVFPTNTTGATGRKAPDQPIKACVISIAAIARRIGAPDDRTNGVYGDRAWRRGFGG
jgi:hypothetical protein